LQCLHFKNKGSSSKVGEKPKSKNSFAKKNSIETTDQKLLQKLFPSELTDYFEITDFQTLCSIEIKKEYWVIEFEEKNELPTGYSSTEYESKGFGSSALIQDFPLRGKAVYLRIKKRRWRHKETGAIIKRDFTFIADGSKFTKDLSDFLKDRS
jgi:hypothetical protein